MSNQRRANNQRRIDPEVVKASRMRLLGRLARAFTLAGLIGATLFTGWWLNGVMTVENWKIEGDAQLKQAIAEQLEAMENRDFMSTRPDMLSEAWMKRQPDLASVQITRVLPDSLHIRAVARVPAALWQDEKNELQLFDDEGNAYRTLRRGESPDLPLLRVSREQLKPAHQLLELLRSQDTGAIPVLSEIRAGNRYWQIYFSKGVTWKLPFGDERGSIAQLSTLIKQPRWSNRNWKIDARQQARWFIRPAKYGGVI